MNFVAKYSIGRLRPNFIEVCQLDILKICDSEYKYIQEYECQNPDKKMVLDAHLSFYSAHSAFSFYIALYISVN